MPPLLEILTSYVPVWVTRRLSLDPVLPAAPAVERFPAAVLFADISGFTPLTERLSKRGPAGIEDLMRMLNAYFGQLIDLVLALGGDVIKFAGDAALAIWPAMDEDLSKATRRAAQCSLALQIMLRDYVAAKDVQLSMRMGIGAGEIVAASFGGVRGRWEFLIAGDPLIQMGLALKQAQPGEVVLSPEAYALVRAYCRGAPVRFPPRAGGSAQDGWRLSDLRETLPPRVSPPLTLAPEMEAALRAFVPGAILARLDAGQTDWLAELRRVTVLFVNLPAIPTALELAQMVMSILQTILYRYEGSIRQLIVDDKGATLIAVLGLPPLAHQDDAVRGVLAAMEMSTELRRLGLRGAVGVTTGQVLCGLVGNERRREYAVLGDTVNLSARLMQAASRRIEKERLLVLCDEATFQAARDRIEFEALPPITVKGKAEPLAVYCPLARKKIKLRPATVLVGRAGERIILADALQTLLMKNTSSVVIIEGEAGIGKSRLAQELCHQAEAFRVDTLYSAADAIEYSTPYYIWRDILAQVLNLDGTVASAQDNQQRILNLLQRLDPELVPLAPLLNPILPVNLPDNDLTAQMSGQVRADNTCDLLVRLLQGTSPKLLVLEDAQWMDAASWELTLRVSLNVQPLLLVIVTRPLGAGWQLGHAPSEYYALLELPQTRHIHLGELEAEETLELVRQRLGVTTLSEPLTNLILGKAEGHPFFAEELAFALRDRGLLQIVGDECRLAASADDWRAIEFPHTVQGAITSRIDCLTPAEQLTLKVASVIGRIFDAQLLSHIYPLESDKARLPDCLQRLEQAGLVVRLSPDVDSDYVFKHALMHEVTYNLLPFAQRQMLHRQIAAWYEQNRPANLYVLVHHWTQAGDIPKALDYLEKAGLEALHNGAHQEAAHFFQEALALEEQQPAAQRSSFQRARWERLLGEACWDGGNVTASFMHARQAMELLGQAAPTGRRGLLAHLVEQATRQAAHRIWPARFFARRTDDAASWELGRIYYRLQMIHYMNNQPWQAMDATLACLNLIESTDPQSAELALAYVGMSLGCGVLALPRLAQLYQRLAEQAATAAGSLAARAYMLKISGLYYMGLGQWTKAQAALDESIEICDRLGDWHAWGESLNVRCLMDYYHGDFASLAQVGEQEWTVGVQRANLQMQTWGLNLKGMHALYAGRLEQSISSVEAAWELLTQHNLERITAILNRGILAVACLRQGRLRSAHEVAYTVAQFIGQALPIWVVSFDGYAAIAQTHLTLWETELTNPSSPGQTDEIATLKSNARQACQLLHRYARAFSMGQPRAWLYQGWYDWLDGKPSSARRAWRRSLALAEQLDMPYEQGLAHYEIGRRAAGAERQHHLALARDLFERLGATYDRERACAELEQG